jgi:hypothetical protein
MRIAHFWTLLALAIMGCGASGETHTGNKPPDSTTTVQPPPPSGYQPVYTVAFDKAVKKGAIQGGYTYEISAIGSVDAVPAYRGFKWSIDGTLVGADSSAITVPLLYGTHHGCVQLLASQLPCLFPDLVVNPVYATTLTIGAMTYVAGSYKVTVTCKAQDEFGTPASTTLDMDGVLTPLTGNTPTVDKTLPPLTSFTATCNPPSGAGASKYFTTPSIPITNISGQVWLAPGLLTLTGADADACANTNASCTPLDAQGKYTLTGPWITNDTVNIRIVCHTPGCKYLSADSTLVKADYAKGLNFSLVESSRTIPTGSSAGITWAVSMAHAYGVADGGWVFFSKYIVPNKQWAVDLVPLWIEQGSLTADQYTAQKAAFQVAIDELNAEHVRARYRMALPGEVTYTSDYDGHEGFQTKGGIIVTTDFLGGGATTLPFTDDVHMTGAHIKVNMIFDLSSQSKGTMKHELTHARFPIDHFHTQQWGHQGLMADDTGAQLPFYDNLHPEEIVLIGVNEDVRKSQLLHGGCGITCVDRQH